MLKPIERVKAQVVKRFTATYAHEAVAEVLGYPLGDEAAWPYVVPLGRPSKHELVEGIEELTSYARVLATFATTHGLEVAYDERIAGGRQLVPVRVIVPDVDAAARVGSRPTTLQLERARDHAQVLVQEFGNRSPEDLVAAVRKCDALDEIDFDLVVRAARWFSSHDASGLTPRQVPLEGFHAKWLDSAGHRALVALLSGRDSLELLSRPAQVDFAYLDPSYLATRRRRLDSYVLGDQWELPYEPELIVIVENKDTYLWFPQVEGAICVFGAGRAGIATIPQLAWVRSCPRLIYWGDMDADGLEILDGYRAAGLPMASVLMDYPSYARYKRYGTSLTPGKRALADHVARRLNHLKPEELSLYRMLTGERFDGPHRIEQERIPLEVACAMIEQLR